MKSKKNPTSHYPLINSIQMKQGEKSFSMWGQDIPLEKGNSGFQCLHQQVGFWIIQSSHRKKITHKNWNIAISPTLCQLL